jgi:hypothetical protein
MALDDASFKRRAAWTAFRTTWIGVVHDPIRRSLNQIRRPGPSDKTRAFEYLTLLAPILTADEGKLKIEQGHPVYLRREVADMAHKIQVQLTATGEVQTVRIHKRVGLKVPLTRAKIMQK